MERLSVLLRIFRASERGLNLHLLFETAQGIHHHVNLWITILALLLERAGDDCLKPGGN